MPFPLTEEQRAVVENRGGALLVSAAAGSGKTRVLVERLLERVEQEGHDIDEFLVITFTNAAAAELRGRIAQELAQRLARDPGNARLRRQTVLVYKTRICTIDALCIDLLRQHGHLLDVDPDFRICDQAEGETIAARVLSELLDERYEDIENDPGFAALVEAVLTGRDDARLVNIVLDIHKRIQSHPDPDRWLAEHREDFRAEGIADAGETPWGALILDHARAQADYWRGEMAKALDLAARDEIVDLNYGPTLSATLEGLENLFQAESWDRAAGCFPIPFPRAGAKRGADPAIKDAIADLRTRCKTRMEAVEALFGADSAGVLSELRSLAPVVEALFDLVREFGRRFYEEKTRRGLLEFSDAEHLTVHLLEQDEVRDLLREQFTEIMVDEYQDTNEVQNVLFDALSRDGENLFLVGDVKQSIYRFRLADPAIFLGKYESWPPAERAEAGQPRKLILSRNFRSRPQVLHAANYVFENIMSRACGEMEYGPAEALVPGGSFEDDPAYAAELDVLSLPEGEGGEDAVDKNLIEARFVARRMAQMLREGFLVDDGAGGQRPVRAEDMVILLRSPGPVLRHYTRALAEAGIPVETEGGGDFFDTTEISVALSLLEIIDNPRQDVPLLSVLRSPVFGFTPDRLSQIRAGCKDGDFYAALEADGGEDCAAFLEQMKLLRFRAGELSAQQLIERLYAETDLMAIFGAMPDGARRQANLAALREQARQLERAGHKGLFGFLTHLGRLRQKGERLAPASAGTGGVKILSIHRSKGLEFPVVFLCGLGRQFNTMDAAAPVLFHPRLGVGPKRLERGEGWTVEWPTLARQAVSLQMDRELKAEEMRLLYVAMTRAKEKLIMTMGLSKAGDALAKLARDAARPVAPAVAAAASTPGRWLLLCALTRPDGEALRTGETDCPVIPAGCGPAWEIRLVPGADYEPPLHARGEVAGEIARPPEEQVEKLAQVLSWTYPHAQAADLPSKLTATQLKGRALDAEAAEDTDTPRPVKHTPFERPDFAAQKLGLTAPQRGTALHKVLQYLDFDKTGSAEEIAGEIDRLAAGQFITGEEARSADPQKLAAFFLSELGRELLAAPVREREYKFSLLLPGEEFFPGAEGEEILFQGVVDCWFEDERGITIVDFKTDRVPEPEQYRPQVEAYARALEELLGKSVARKALYFFATGEIFFL
ncbi:MAG: helicase-exonuclease AddAB subunit AddA [Oscillospiraceae bacterium]